MNKEGQGLEARGNRAGQNHKIWRSFGYLVFSGVSAIHTYLVA